MIQGLLLASLVILGFLSIGFMIQSIHTEIEAKFMQIVSLDSQIMRRMEALENEIVRIRKRKGAQND